MTGVEITDELIQEYVDKYIEIDHEITTEYNGDVLSWVKNKLDLYIVGEDNNKQLLFLIMVSKDLEDPMHASVEGPSSLGKTTLVERTTEAMPPDSVKKLSRITPTYLDYIKNQLKNKVLLVQQIQGSESSQNTLHVMMSD